MKDKIQKQLVQAHFNLKTLEDENMKSWDVTKKDNDKNFTPVVERQRQFYFGVIHGLELALDVIK